MVVLPTVGGATIDIRGQGLGLSPSAVTVSYTGGSEGMRRRSHTLPPGACTLVSPGTALRYVSLNDTGPAAMLPLRAMTAWGDVAAREQTAREATGEP